MNYVLMYDAIDYCLNRMYHFDIRPAGINSLFPLSQPTLQKGAAQKILVKNFILFFAIYTVNLVYYHNKRIRMSTGSHIYLGFFHKQ